MPESLPRQLSDALLDHANGREGVHVFVEPPDSNHSVKRLPLDEARRKIMADLRLGIVAVTCLLASTCATTAVGGPDAFRGTSGSVAWEVVDIGRIASADNQRFRWSYTIVLRNTGDTTIEITRVERSLSASARGDIIGGTPTSQALRRTLRAGSELRVPASDDWGWIRGGTFGGAATLSPITVRRRFFGTDQTGRPIEIDVQVRLDRGVGRLSTPPTAPEQLPAQRTLQASDLGSLVGTWRGSYRGERSPFDIPVEVTIAPDGTFQAGDNDPVTNRFSGTLRVQDGKLQYSQRRDSGTLALHEAGGKRMLVGRVSGPRDDGSTFSSSLYLEAASTPVAATAPPAPAPPAISALAPAQGSFSTVDAPVWKRGDEWTFRWESPRGKGTFVWTVDREEAVDGVEYYVITSGRQRESYWRKADLAYYMEKVEGVIEERIVPPFVRFAWPLLPGSAWEQDHRNERPRDRQTEDIALTCRVEAEETITVPAGSFQTLKIVCQNRRTGAITSERYYSPMVKQVIQERTYFSYGIRTRELTGVKLE